MPGQPRYLTSIRSKFYFLLLTVLVPVLLLQATYSYKRYQTRRSNEFRMNLEVARAVAETFEEFVHSIIHQELAIGANFTMPQTVAVEEMNRLLDLNRADHPAVREFTWIDPQGEIIASSTEALIGENVSDRAYFREVVAGREWVLSDLLLSKGTGLPIFCITRGIRDKEGNLLGIVLASVSPDRLGDLLRIELSRGWAVTFIDKAGMAVFQYPRMEWKWEERYLVDKRPAIASALRGTEVVGTFPCFTTGEQRMAALCPARSTGWVVGAGRLRRAVMAPITFEILLQAVLSFLVTLAVFLAAIAISKNITAPIRELGEHALALGRGSLHRRIEVGGGAELRDLAVAFNTMAEKIGAREEELRLDEVRFEALYALSQLTEVSRKEIEDFVLEQEMKITGSKVGFISFLSEDETACTTHIGSRDAAGEGPPARTGPFRFDVDRASLWLDVVRSREPLAVNDCFNPALNSFPLDALGLVRLVVVPIFEGNRIVALAGVGNKEADYNASDARQLTLLLDGMWKHIRREEAEASLRQSESLAAIGRAMAAVAHEMRTPLIAIGGFTRLIQKHLGKGCPDHDKLEIVVQETGRLEKMVRDILDFSRPLKLERSLGDMNRLIAESLAMVAPLARQKNVTLQNPGRDAPAEVSFDAVRMKQVLINLLINAVQASPEGGEALIRCGRKGADFSIEVMDHGCGIPEERKEEIFSPFFTTRKEGTGLGLPIVKKIVEAHEGRIEVLDNPEEGVTFRVSIPADR